MLREVAKIEISRESPIMRKVWQVVKLYEYVEHVFLQKYEDDNNANYEFRNEICFVVSCRISNEIPAFSYLLPKGDDAWARYKAVDRVAGMAMTCGTYPRNCFIVSTGGLTGDMVLKAGR